MTVSDLVWYPEANYLLNPSGKDNQEAINIHLNLLETEGTFTKELVQWGGLSTVTKGGNYSLVAITRPIEDIKKHIVYNGLLQRCIFIPRKLTKLDRKMMLEQVALYSHIPKKKRMEYRKDFNILLKDMEEIQNFALQYTPEIRDEDSEIFVSEMNKKLSYFDDSIQTECSIESNKEIFEDFIANYRNLILMVTYQSAVIRRSKWVELVDLEYAFNFMKEPFELMKPWIEENINVSKVEIERLNSRKNCLLKMKQMFKGVAIIKIPDAINYVKKELMVSYPTAKQIIETFSEEGPFKMIAINWQKREMKFIV